MLKAVLKGSLAALLFSSMSYADVQSEITHSPWKDSFNVYSYLKSPTGECLTQWDGSSCGSNAYSVTQFSKRDGFNGFSFRLSWADVEIDIDQNGTNETVSKYSGNLGTYTAKHYPTAVEHNNNVYFVHSGPVVVEGLGKYGSTSGGGRSISSFKRSDGKTNALGIYVSKVNPASNKVTKPTLVHMLYKDDPHQNAVLNVDAQGYIYILIAGSAANSGSFIFRSKYPNNIDDFVDVSPATFDYSQTDPFKNNSSKPLYRGITYPKLFWVPDGYFRVIYTMHCKNRTYKTDPCNGKARNALITAELHPNGTNPIQMKNVKVLANYRGNYVVGNAKGNDIVLAFNIYLNEDVHGGSIDDRTNLYYMHSSDGGLSWQNAKNQNIQFPIQSEAGYEQIVARKYFREGEPVTRKIFMKDINFTGSGANKKPMILYVGVTHNDTSIDASLTAHHYLAKSFYDGYNWSQEKISNDVDHSYSSGTLVLSDPNKSAYDVYFPQTPDHTVHGDLKNLNTSYNNALAGGAIAVMATKGSDIYQGEGHASRLTEKLMHPRVDSPDTYFDELCEFNYIRSIHNASTYSKFVAIAAGGNPYQYSGHNPLVLVNRNKTVTSALPLNITSVDSNNMTNLTRYTSCKTLK